MVNIIYVPLLVYLRNRIQKIKLIKYNIRLYRNLVSPVWEEKKMFLYFYIGYLLAQIM